MGLGSPIKEESAGVSEENAGDLDGDFLVGGGGDDPSRHELALEGMMGIEVHNKDCHAATEDDLHCRPEEDPSPEERSAHAKIFARVDMPLRVEPPPSFNAPSRPPEQSQEQQIKARQGGGAAPVSRSIRYKS